MKQLEESSTNSAFVSKFSPNTPKKLLALGLAGISLLISGIGRATGPADQIVSPDPAGGTLYSIVDFMMAGDTSDNGTGSIINKYIDGNGVGHFDVLTADHVVTPSVNRIAIGSSGGVAPAASQILPYTVVARGGDNGTEDLAIVDATVGNVNTSPSALTLFNNVTPLTIANPMLRPLQTNDLFTQYGYGNTGVAVNDPTRPAGQQAGYSVVNSSFVKRFQNNTVLGITGDLASPGGYTEEQILWNTVAPANNNGYGTSFGGDSGGPYLSSFPTTITVNRGGTNIDIIALTDYIVGVHLGGTSVTNFDASGSTKFNGMGNWGAYMDQDDFNWVYSQIAPEPSSFAIIFAGGLVLLYARRRSFARNQRQGSTQT